MMICLDPINIPYFVMPDLGPFCFEGKNHQTTHACNKNHLTQPHCMGSIRHVDLLIFVYRLIHSKTNGYMRSAKTRKRCLRSVAFN